MPKINKRCFATAKLYTETSKLGNQQSEIDMVRCGIMTQKYLKRKRYKKASFRCSVELTAYLFAYMSLLAPTTALLFPATFIMENFQFAKVNITK